MKTQQDRFWGKVNKTSENKCWEWTGYTLPPFIKSFTDSDKGYGRFWFLNKFWLAHRVSWFIKNGEIPDGLCVLHTCDNPPCVNPNHLFLGTKKDNSEDMITKGRNSN